MRETLQTLLGTLQEVKKVEVDLAEQVQRKRRRATCIDRVRRLDRKESIINRLTRVKTMRTLVIALKRIEVFLQGEEEVDLGLE